VGQLRTTLLLACIASYAVWSMERAQTSRFPALSHDPSWKRLSDRYTQTQMKLGFFTYAHNTTKKERDDEKDRIIHSALNRLEKKTKVPLSIHLMTYSDDQLKTICFEAFIRSVPRHVDESFRQAVVNKITYLGVDDFNERMKNAVSTSRKKLVRKLVALISAVLGVGTLVYWYKRSTA
jgi:hypothetical protein